MVHEHWDGSSRPRNVNYATRRLGDHEPYFSYGSGGPGDASRGRRGRLEVTLRSYSSVLEYGPERVNVSDRFRVTDAQRGVTICICIQLS